MKARVADRRSSPPPPSFYKYLKPGALAQLRYSKITARSKEIDARILLELCQLKPSTDSAFSQARSSGIAMEGIPCFNWRFKGHPRCLQRKKLIAVTPVFSETQS